MSSRTVIETVAVPGPTATKFFKRAGMLDTEMGQASKDDAATVAQQGVNALLAGANTAKGGKGNDTIDVRDGVNSNGDKADGGDGTDTCQADTGDTKIACEA